MYTDDLKLARHNLGSIDFTEIEEKQQSDQDRKDYCAAIHAIFPRIEADMKRFILHQAIFIAKESANFEQVAFGRGGIDALQQALDHWSAAHHEHMDRSTNKGEFDKFNPVSEL